MKIEIYGPDEPLQVPVVKDFEAFHEQLQSYPLEDVLQWLEDLSHFRASHLLHTYTDNSIPAVEREQALHDCLIVPMAQEPLINVTGHVHNPYAAPAWLKLARMQLEEFTIKGIPAREILADSDIFNDDPQLQRRLANDVSASIMPYGTYEDQAFAAGVAIGQVRTWSLPHITADEMEIT